jgi:hypothetical protein
MAQKKFDDDLLGTKLCGETAEPNLIFVCRNPNHELLAKILCQFLFQANRRLVINVVPVLEHAQRGAQILLRKSLHSDQQATTMPWPSRPTVNILIKCFPAAQVEVTNTKVSMVREAECFP